MDDELSLVGLGIVIGIIVGVVGGVFMTKKTWMRHAVEVGKAEFYLENPGDKEPRWRWKP